MASLEYSWMSEMCSGDVTYPVTIVIDLHESSLRRILTPSLVSVEEIFFSSQYTFWEVEIYDLYLFLRPQIFDAENFKRPQKIF